MSQPFMLCPHCLHALGADRVLDDTRLLCNRCGIYWQFDDANERWYKYFD